MGRDIDENNRILGLYGSDLEEDRHRNYHLSPPPPPISFTAPPTSPALTFSQIHIATNEWVSKIGPIDSWPRRFQQELDKFREAVEVPLYMRRDGLERFLRDVEDTVEEGRGLLKRLRRTPQTLGPLSLETWGGFIAIGDLMDTLYSGVHLLEARLDILSPRAPWAAEGDSGFRRYSNFLDNLHTSDST